MPDDNQCASCGGLGSWEELDEEFQWNAGAKAVLLKVRVPVFTCSACGDQVTDWRGEEIRTEAVRRMRAERGI